jgi:hypothetical protein
MAWGRAGEGLVAEVSQGVMSPPQELPSDGECGPADSDPGLGLKVVGVVGGGVAVRGLGGLVQGPPEELGSLAWNVPPAGSADDAAFDEHGGERLYSKSLSLFRPIRRRGSTRFRARDKVERRRWPPAWASVPSRLTMSRWANPAGG